MAYMNDRRSFCRVKTKPAPEGAGDNLTTSLRLRAGVKHGDGTTILRPAGDVVTNRDRAFLAVRDRAHPARIDALRGEEGANRLGAPRPKRDVVFAGAALIRMALDGEGIAVVGLQPLHLLVQRSDRLRRQIGLVALEEHAVADIDHEILLA